MADLLTHSLVNYVVGASSGRLRAGEVSWLVSGGLLPDLLSRVPTMALEALPLPQSLSQSLCGVFEGGELFHTPVGIAGFALAVCLLLPSVFVAPPGRLRAGALLAAGGLLHIGIDLLQRHLVPGYIPLYPLSRSWFEVGLFPETASHYSWPVLIPLALYVRHRSRVQDRGDEPAGPCSPPGVTSGS